MKTLNEKIGESKSVYVIAEAGVNHNGNYELACRLADAAKSAGADCVKYQTFNSNELTSRFAEKASYQKENTNINESQQEMLRQLELSHEEFWKLKEYCDSIGICFVSTPFDIESIYFLDAFDMPFWKIPSGELTNLPYLLEIAKTKKPVVLSTGMSNIDEVETTVRTLSSNGTDSIAVLHCNTEYPTPLEDVNLRAMQTLRNRLNVSVGYSDHTLGIEVPIAAVAMGATIIEKHFTLDKTMEGPDHRASLEPDELRQMISCIRDIEIVLGNGIKFPTKSEQKNISIVRKSIVAKTAIKKGEILTEANITTKRPGNGISPMRWYDVLGTQASRDFDEDEQID